MSSTNAGSFAAGVSRALRVRGLRPLPSGTPIVREGVRVERGYADNRASVRVDIDLPRKALRYADDIEEALTEAGYIVERAAGAVTMQVTR